MKYRKSVQGTDGRTYYFSMTKSIFYINRRGTKVYVTDKFKELPENVKNAYWKMEW